MPKRTPQPRSKFVAFEHGPHRGITKSGMEARLQKMLTLLKLPHAELSVVFSNDAALHQLNRDYRKKDRPTDVLAFAMREGDFAEHAGNLLGDVVISVETARRQAKERGLTVLDEATMLMAHGLLHLLGWDHDTEKKDQRMRAKTEELCRAARKA